MKKPTDEELICSHWDETLFESQEDDDSVTIGHRQVRRPAARRSLVTSSEDLGRSAVASDVHAAEGVSIESAALDTDKTGRFERIIVCGAPELGRAQPWHGTMPRVSEPQIFWYGDNLEVMREHIQDDTVDLIYLDPPFNSQRIFNRFFGEEDGSPSDAQRKAFEDYWRWSKEAEAAYSEILHPRARRYAVPAALSQTMELLRGLLHESNMLAYLSMMGIRLIEMRRVLKRTGMLYLHCDPTASHYLKLILDALFDQRNFRNEIVWKRTGAHNSTDGFGPVHDSILVYAKSEDARCEPEKADYSDKYKEKFGKICNVRGQHFQDVTLTGPGVRKGESGKPWRGYNPTDKNRHWQPASYVYKKYLELTGEDLAQYPLLERFDKLDEAGMIYWTKNMQPRYKQYLDDAEGLPAQDVWTDIPAINSQAEERTDYPTQKPIALLKRIIQASSKPGDLVLDPFCGCGTAVVAAQELGRQWIGIDITHVAVSVLKKRLEKKFPGLRYRVRGEPEDVASARRLADEKWEEFQAWIVDRVGGIPLNPTEEKKVAKKGKDGGIDGYFLFRDDPKAARSKRMILSVKAGKVLAPDMVDSLFGVVSREHVTAGALLTAYPVTLGMRKIALAYGHYDSELFAPGKLYPKVQIVTVDEIFDPKWRGLEYPGSNTSRRT